MEDQQPRSIGARMASAACARDSRAPSARYWFLLRHRPSRHARGSPSRLARRPVLDRSVSCPPIMGLVGLPGDAALVFISSVFLNIYSADRRSLLDVPSTCGSATILAIMCLTAHNLIVETAVMKKTGSSGSKMVFLRIVARLRRRLRLQPPFAGLPEVRPLLLGVDIRRAPGISSACLPPGASRPPVTRP